MGVGVEVELGGRGGESEETPERTRIQGWPCGGGEEEGDWSSGNTAYK